MSAAFHRIENDAVGILFNPEGGHLEDVVFHAGGRALRPLHRTPWRDDGDVLADTPVSLRNLAGNVFCAPFYEPDVEPAPWHGWTSIGLWHLDAVEEVTPGTTTTRFRLERTVMGATVTKEITLRAGHPFIYQRHIFTGGRGAVPVAHHAMVRTDQGIVLSFSPKAFGLTPDQPVETDPSRGRSALLYPQHFADLTRLRLADGRQIDGTHHPIDHNAEDLVLLVDQPDQDFAWSAALSPAGGFLFVAIKEPRTLPATMLWMSNFGRAYPPWYGRHSHCLGIEEICANGASGHRSSIEPNAPSRENIPTSLKLQPEQPTIVDYAFGAIPVDSRWQRIQAIERSVGAIHIHDRSGISERARFAVP